MYNKKQIIWYLLLLFIYFLHVDINNSYAFRLSTQYIELKHHV